jgi:hypothetical protein
MALHPCSVFCLNRRLPHAPQLDHLCAGALRRQQGTTSRCHSKPVQVAFLLVTGPLRQTSSSQSATAAHTPGTALCSSDSTSIAAPTRASREVALCTHTRDTIADGMSAASASATRLFLSSSTSSPHRPVAPTSRLTVPRTLLKQILVVLPPPDPDASAPWPPSSLAPVSPPSSSRSQAHINPWSP